MQRRSGIVIMSKLIGLLKGLIPIMIVAILLGTIGYLCAISITIFGAQIIASHIEPSGILSHISTESLIIMMIAAAICRGVFHYIEQYCNHFIAFKLLAIIRHNIFCALRKLCPAKLDGKDKGNLISIITTDIELLEVFYAHTISPIFIAIATSAILIAFFFQYSIYAALLATIAYCVVGILVPLFNGSRGKKYGSDYREEFGELNSFVLESLRGLDDIIQYSCGDKRLDELNSRTSQIASSQEKLTAFEGSQRSITNIVIIISSVCMLCLCAYLQVNGQMTINATIICTIAMMGSFGPVVAIASLSNNLNQTLASGERVLEILEEKPAFDEVSNQSTLATSDMTNIAEFKNVDFGYKEEKILSNLSIKFDRGKIIGILGASGCGKSTILKLLMRFYDPDSGTVRVENRDVKTINTDDLRDKFSYVTQETHLFNDSIANNIAIAKLDATQEEIENAAKCASIHDFIMTLDVGYDTNIGELGDMLSGGEKQRLGLARAFLHDGDIMLLDEPTSNLDALNEGIILKSLSESAEDKTIIFVSHRASTLALADNLIKIESLRAS